MKQKELSLWMKALDIFMMCGCLLFAYVLVPLEAYEAGLNHPEWPDPIPVGLAFGTVAIIAPVAAGVVAWRIFTRIGQDNSFCVENAKALRAISYLAVAEIVVFFLASLALLMVGILSGGYVLILLVVIVVFVALAVIAAVLSHLTLKAARLQDENDLTV